MSKKSNQRYHFFFIWTLTIVLYGQIISYPFVNWDDPIHVYQNPSINAPKTQPLAERWFPKSLGYPMPLTILSYRIDRALYGPTSPDKVQMSQGRGYHLTNLLLLLVLLTALYSFFRNLFKANWLALIGTLLFLLHPAIVEPIAWVSGRKDLLAAVFVILSLRSWLKQLQTPKKLGWLTCSLFPLLAMCSKPNAIGLLPFLAWLLWLQRKQTSQILQQSSETQEPRTTNGFRVQFALLTFLSSFGLAIIWFGMTWQKQLGAIATNQTLLSAARRVVWSLGFHLSLLFWPVHLRPRYEQLPNAWSLFDFIGFIAIIVFLGLLFHPKSRRGYFGFGSALLISLYLPVSNLVPLQRYVADSYVFLPFVGLLICLLALLKVYYEKKKYAWKVIRSSLFITFVVLGSFSFFQIQIWQSSHLLWFYMFQKEATPTSCRMLGHSYSETHRYKLAAKVYEGCIKRYGKKLYANNLAVTYFLLGNYEKSRKLFEWIIERNPEEPRALKYLEAIRNSR